MENECVIEILKNGPLVVHGNIVIKDQHGNEQRKEKRTSFCRCGHSQNKPYCDGSHRKNEFEG